MFNAFVTTKIQDKLWYLQEPFGFRDHKGKLHNIPKYFITDFQSTPSWAEWVAPHRGIADFAALGHDWLYYIQTEPREYADMFFKFALIQTKQLLWVRCQARYLALRAAGGKAWEQNKKNNLLYSMQHRFFDAPESVILLG